MTPAVPADLDAWIGLIADAGGADERWRAALHAVPRHLFAPERGWCNAPPAGRRIDRDADPDGWWDAVYAPSVSILTQADDGAGDPLTGQGLWTSALSAPRIVVEFLRQLHVHDHQRVLEIGTGTGWTAALLAHRVGDGNVVTVEIDEDVAKHAAANLDAAGRAPQVVVGDGAGGWPDGAPYDRVHATCAVRRVPHAWVEQVRPGGVIVFPWSPGFGTGHQVRLVVGDGGTAVGGFPGGAGYMMLRAQRYPTRWGPFEETAAEMGSTRLDPRSIAWDLHGVDVALTALVPDVKSWSETEGERFSLLLATFDRSSWAWCDFEPGRADFEVGQYGDRRLWDETADAYLRWVSWGRPDRDRFGMTVAPDGQHVWLGTPENVVSPASR